MLFFIIYVCLAFMYALDVQRVDLFQCCKTVPAVVVVVVV